MTQYKLFCFGYGYSCEHLKSFLDNDPHNQWQICGTSRDPDRVQAMRDQGISAFRFDFDEDRMLADPDYYLYGVTHVLISTPPGNEGDPSFVAHGQDLLRISSLQWVGYLSSTSVYGDRGGRWVNENSEVTPTSKRGSRRAMAENQWLSLFEHHYLPVHLFRLSGIYGPGRSALDSVRCGMARRIDKPGHAFNRIHVDDISQVLYKSMINPSPGEAYNLADDLPSTSLEVITHACDLLGIEPPPIISYEEADIAPIMKSFYNDNKRISNQKIKEKLGVVLKYPNYESGLHACLDADIEGDEDMRASL